MEPADEFGAENIRLWLLLQALPHGHLGVDMGDAEMLVPALVVLVRKIPAEGLFDIPGEGFVAFDEIRVVAVHLTDEPGNLLSDDF